MESWSRRALGEVEAANAFHVVMVALRQRNLDVLEAELLSAADPDSENYLQFWSRERVSELTAPDPESTRAVLAHLEEAGLQIVGQSARGEYIKANGSVNVWSRLFQGADFHAYEHSETGAVVYRTEQGKPVSLPATLTKHVAAVFNVAFEPALLTRPSSRRATAGDASVEEEEVVEKDAEESGSRDLLGSTNIPAITLPDRVTPYLLAKLYGISGRGDAGVSQAVYSTNEQFWSALDLAGFASAFGLPSAQVSDLGPNRLSNAICLDPNMCNESMLDLEYLTALTPGMPTYNWYDTENEDLFVSWIYTVTAMTTAPPGVISISYGVPESAIRGGGQLAQNLVTQFDTEAKKLGLMGVSIIVSSGDFGSIGSFYALINGNSCNLDVMWPASSPWVTSVGATMGPENGNHADLRERVCMATNGSDASSGGGFSQIYLRPNWQAVATTGYLSPSQFHTITGRGVPDVAALGNNYRTLIGGSWYRLSGTSASAPVVAAMVSLINAQRHRQGNGTLGFLNPTLYAIASSSPQAYAASFIDITVGSNNNYAKYQGGRGLQKISCPPTVGWNAAPGWDPTTGLGSFKFGGIKQALVNATARTMKFPRDTAALGSPGPTSPLTSTQLGIMLGLLLLATLAGGWTCYKRKCHQRRLGRDWATAAVPIQPIGIRTGTGTAGGADIELGVVVLPDDAAGARGAAQMALPVMNARPAQGAHASTYRQAAEDDPGLDELPVARAEVVKVQIFPARAERLG